MAWHLDKTVEHIVQVKVNSTRISYIPTLYNKSVKPNSKTVCPSDRVQRREQRVFWQRSKGVRLQRQLLRAAV